MVKRTPSRTSGTKKTSPARRAPSRAAPEPFLRFHHPRDLRARTEAVLDKIESAKDATPHAEALAALVVELTDAGISSFFMAPLRAANVGFIVEQSVSFGLSSAQAMIAPLIRSVIGRMTHDQLLVVTAHLRGFMK